MEELKENQAQLFMELSEENKQQLLQFIYQEVRKIFKLYFQH